jgi:hypothetical protein
MLSRPTEVYPTLNPVRIPFVHPMIPAIICTVVSRIVYQIFSLPVVCEEVEWMIYSIYQVCPLTWRPKEGFGFFFSPFSSWISLPIANPILERDYRSLKGIFKFIQRARHSSGSQMAVRESAARQHPRKLTRQKYQNLAGPVPIYWTDFLSRPLRTRFTRITSVLARDPDVGQVRENQD